MKLSRESEYGLKALVYLATQPPGSIIQAGRLAEAAGLPPMFLAKTLRKLTRHGILRSHQGRNRGYGLGRPPGEICVREVLETIEGPDLFERCVFWSDLCSERNPCLLHETWRTVRPVMRELMEHISLDEVAEGHPLPGVAGARFVRGTASSGPGGRSRPSRVGP